MVNNFGVPLGAGYTGANFLKVETELKLCRQVKDSTGQAIRGCHNSWTHREAWQ